MHYTLTVKSGNAKTGPIPVSTSSAATCPDACPFKAGGCYANGGPLKIHWSAVTEHRRGTPWAQFLSRIKALPDAQLWRHNQAGDLPGTNNLLDTAALKQLVQANHGKRGFTYTHKPLTKPSDRAAIRDANASGFTINLSANNPTHADALADLNIGPVATVLPSDAPRKSLTPAGRTIVTCPATYRDDISCATCALCARQRSTIVGFPAHGPSTHKADAIARSL